MSENTQHCNLPDEVKTEGYRDLAQPAVRHIGRWIGALCGKLDKYSVQMEMENNAAVESIQKHYQSIPEQFRTNPKPQITYNAEQGFLLSTGQPDLQALFVNLMKSCCDSRTASGVLPSFVTILQQLTSDEAKLLEFCYKIFINSHQLPVLQILSHQKGKSDNGYLTHHSHFTNLGELANCEYPNNVPVYLANLERLGTISISYEKYYIDTEAYEHLKNTKAAQEIKQKIESSGRTVTFKYGMVELTPFGLGLCRACSMDTA